ncbi:MAG: hypothetical protein NTX35_02080 [Verrucomicrobia bacterium]|nr:hypothetical protein [Verrucomicrobiota bacterium]
MTTTQILMTLGGLLVLTACGSSPKPQEAARPASVPIEVILYRIPESQFRIEETGYFDFTADAMRRLSSSKPLFRTKLDVARGVPVTAFAPQTRSDFKSELELVKARGDAHKWCTDALNYLVPPRYHNTGFTDWYLVNRDSDSHITNVLGSRATCGAGEMLIYGASPGDQILGAWSPRKRVR